MIIDTHAKARAVLGSMKFGMHTNEEIMDAIRYVANHETANGIPKEYMRDALKWVAENCELKPMMAKGMPDTTEDW